LPPSFKDFCLASEDGNDLEEDAAVIGIFFVFLALLLQLAKFVRVNVAARCICAPPNPAMMCALLFFFFFFFFFFFSF
tara:strand:- start:1687 stop:1920 length:234 start_codon:yes stop_codon:yes gene_type:complete